MVLPSGYSTIARDSARTCYAEPRSFVEAFVEQISVGDMVFVVARRRSRQRSYGW